MLINSSDVVCCNDEIIVKVSYLTSVFVTKDRI